MYFFAAWPALWMTVNLFTNKLFSFIEWWFYREALFYLDSVRRTARGLIFMCLVCGGPGTLLVALGVCSFQVFALLTGKTPDESTPMRRGKLTGKHVFARVLADTVVPARVLLQILPWFVLCFWQMWCADNECEAIGTYKKVGRPDVPLPAGLMHTLTACLV